MSDKSTEYIGIDEFHLFKPEDIKHLGRLSGENNNVIVAGLDMDYRGKFFETYKALLQLDPEKVIHKHAICEVCKKDNAIYTQILSLTGRPIIGSLPSIVVEDGKYRYQPRCSNCFVKAN